MKRIVFVIIVLISTFELSAQALEVDAQENSSTYTVPSNFLDLGVGLGPNYGLIGAKAVIGIKGTGFLIGVGDFDGFRTFSIGVQITYQEWFASVSYGPTGSYSVEFNGVVDKGITKSIVFIAGGRINLNPNKRLFLELGLGFTGSDDIPNPPFGRQEYEGGVTANIGLGYRIGTLY